MKLFFSSGNEVGNEEEFADRIPSRVEGGAFTSDLFVDFESGNGRELFMTKSRLWEIFVFYAKAKRHPFFYSDMAGDLLRQAEKMELGRIAPKPKKQKKPKDKCL